MTLYCQVDAKMHHKECLKINFEKHQFLKPFFWHKVALWTQALPKRDYTIPRLPECLSLRPNWLPPPPPPQASVSPPPPRNQMERGHTRLLVREQVEPIRTTSWRESLALCILCGFYLLLGNVANWSFLYFLVGKSVLATSLQCRLLLLLFSCIYLCTNGTNVG